MKTIQRLRSRSILKYVKRGGIAVLERSGCSAFNAVVQAKL